MNTFLKISVAEMLATKVNFRAVVETVRSVYRLQNACLRVAA